MSECDALDFNTTWKDRSMNWMHSVLTSGYFQSLEDVEKDTIIKNRVELVAQVRKAFEAFVEYWKDDCHCICWDCFIVWTRSSYLDMVSDMAADWCWLVNVTGYKNQ